MKRTKALVKTGKSSAKASLAAVSKRVRRVPAQLKLAANKLAAAKTKTEHLIKKNPLGAVAGASAIGFVVAKLKRYV